VIPDSLNHATQGELQRYENDYKALNLITTTLGRNVYDRVAHLEMAHDVWLKLCNMYEGSSDDCTRLSLRKPESPLMIVLLALSLLLAAYIHLVLLIILIMNVINNCCMLLMILYGA
jgi:hypothetical protein